MSDVSDWYVECNRLLSRARQVNLRDRDITQLAQGLEFFMGYINVLVNQIEGMDKEMTEREDAVMDMAEHIDFLEDMKNLINTTVWYAGWVSGWTAQKDGRSMACVAEEFEKYKDCIRTLYSANVVFYEPKEEYTIDFDEDLFGLREEWDTGDEEWARLSEEELDEWEESLPDYVNTPADREYTYTKVGHPSISTDKYVTSRSRQYFGPETKVTDRELHENHMRMEAQSELSCVEVTPEIRKAVMHALDKVRECALEAEKEKAQREQVSHTEFFKLKHENQMLIREIDKLRDDINTIMKNLSGNN